jgi:hypothetical protein
LAAVFFLTTFKKKNYCCGWLGGDTGGYRSSARAGTTVALVKQVVFFFLKGGYTCCGWLGGDTGGSRS